MVEGEHYKVLHKTQKHQIQIVRTAQDGPEKRKGKGVLDNSYSTFVETILVTPYVRIIGGLPELVIV